MNPQTKLKVVAEEIKEILKKHDVAGSIVIQTPGHGEFINHFLTSYSCAYMYEDNSVRFYSKAKDYNSQEEQMKQLESTSNMLKILTDLVAQNFLMLEPLSKKFDALTNAKHHS